MDIFSVSTSVLNPSDIARIQQGFLARLGTIHNNHDRLELGDLTLVCHGKGQAVFVRECDAHNERCDCVVCTRVRELLDQEPQELNPKNIWGATTKLLPFDETGDRRIFLAHVAYSLTGFINTDPCPLVSTKKGDDSGIYAPLEMGREIDIITGRVRRNVTPCATKPVGYLK